MITIDDLFFFVLYVGTIAYLTKVLLADHIGPFSNEDDCRVLVGDVAYPVDLFHRIKRILGLYREENGLWIARSTVLWQCPYCLSFWINLMGIGILFALGFHQERHLIAMILAVPFAVGYILTND